MCEPAFSLGTTQKKKQRKNVFLHSSTLLVVSQHCLLPLESTFTLHSVHHLAAWRVLNVHVRRRVHSTRRVRRLSLCAAGDAAAAAVGVRRRPSKAAGHGGHRLMMSLCEPEKCHLWLWPMSTRTWVYRGSSCLATTRYLAVLRPSRFIRYQAIRTRAILQRG
ncbi:hypothetical protein ISCGN_013063 [Ixodes scapularis]